MANQVRGDGTIVPPFDISAPTPLINLNGFHWTTVDNKFHRGQLLKDGTRDGQDDSSSSGNQSVAQESIATEPVSRIAAQAPSDRRPEQPGIQLFPRLGASRPAAPLFPIDKFQGAFAGNGFNTIFRPRPNPGARDGNDGLGPVAQTPLPDDNILELNLTLEQLTFGHTIGAIPNRGFASQPDITLGGLPYLQTIQDVTNPETGMGDNPNKNDIHFEPGMWLNVPQTISNPIAGPSIVRMASIPHGTTILAQGLAPAPTNTTSKGVSGGPMINDVNTTPVFVQDIGATKAGTLQPFPSMTASNKETARLPQNLDAFIKKGTITDDIIKNPNLVLKKAIKGMNILETITFEVATGPTGMPPLNGGGTANIAFLLGSQAGATAQNPVPAPNAHAASMSSRFWIETVEYDVNVPAFTLPEPQAIFATPPNPDAPVPVFLVTPPAKLPSPAQTIKARGVQIQYSQVVNLVFGPLSWPHVNVATLVPTTPQPVKMT